MVREIIFGILIPFLGTSIGAFFVLFMQQGIRLRMMSLLSGFAAGVMTAASIWSLLIPAIEQSEKMGRWAFIPGVLGFLLGILILMLLDDLVSFLHKKREGVWNERSKFETTMMLVFAVTLHNIPEGMAVGVAYAGCLAGNTGITMVGALALAVGIGIQNVPEGAIVALPLKAAGMKKRTAFFGGLLSGVVEPIGAGITILATRQIVVVLPYLLSFAAGAMMYVVIKELIPDMLQEDKKHAGILFFAVGFCVMMALDVALSC